MRENIKKYRLKPNPVPEFINNSLDLEQLDAVVNSVGRTLIVAGPGSGKTRVITYKIAYLVSSGIKPENILLVTFTRAASHEMIERARRVSGSDLKGMLAGTFHHVCNHFLRKYSKRVDIDANFTILDREDAKDLIKHCRAQLIEELGKKNSSILPSAGVLQSIYSYAVNCGLSLREAIVHQNKKFLGIEEHIEEIWKRYTVLKLENNSMDYDDLLVKALQLFENNSEVLEIESTRFRWILVDEFQDTNILQYRLLELLSNVHGNLIVVGDDAQSIYSFRGARFENVFDFLNKGDTKVFKIQTNYRSTPEIVKLINNIVPTNSVEKNLKAVRTSGPLPVVAETWDNMEEANFVAQKIEEHINDGISPERIAVLYRSHYHSLELQMELDRRKIDYILFSGPKFVETAHVKDIISFLKVLINPSDQLSWGRVLRLFPGVGISTSLKIIDSLRTCMGDQKRIIEKLKAFSTSRIKLEHLIDILSSADAELQPANVIQLVHNNFYENYLDEKYPDARERKLDIERLEEIAERYSGISEFLEDLAVSEKVDIERERVEKESKVVLSTVHQAKGLEWDVVFVIAVNPGDFPSYFAVNEGNIDEEERVFYVAITRARDYLYLVRQKGGRSRPMMGNRYVFRSGYDFITRIPEDAVEFWDVGWDL
ncbi:ATP-dependent helicase [Kosmotoga pacifica]|uniref:ATP-dependent helicase n=1 Tax=Kosmotoga pacifica TaxID=1330330 RepID=UPI000B23FF44|nr:ATP-dependent helicase [Kosmotoga pacifica]